jgi:hypothetical protein
MPVVEHFEIPVDNIKRAQKFYEDVFGWQTHKWVDRNDPNLDYWGFETYDKEGNRGSTGGIMKRQGSDHTVINYVEVSSINEYIPKIVKNGGKIIEPRTDVDGQGTYTMIFLDSENNMFGLVESKNAQ